MKLKTKMAWKSGVVVICILLNVTAVALELNHSHILACSFWAAAMAIATVMSILTDIIARRMARDLSALTACANAIASGDMTSKVVVADESFEVVDLARSVNSMQNRLREVMAAYAELSSTLVTSAQSMKSSSDGVHRRMDQQSQQTQQAATAMTEMSTSIAEVSRHTQDAAQSARDAAATAREGGAIVGDMLVAIESLHSAVSRSASTIGLLDDDSKKISQIVNVIDDIAKKTNLLALNAAIEAARAGEQGRGFAVVAGEVRRLAESTAKATGEIASMILGIQQRTNAATAEMELGTKIVSDSAGTTRQAGEALERIIGMADRVDTMIAQIAVATAQQATAADQSSASLSAIHALSGENLSEMAVTAQGIEALTEAAVAMEVQAGSSLVTRKRNTGHSVFTSHGGWATA